MANHESRKKPHALMISVPYQGHINPFVSLALKLASKGFTITFVHHEIVHHRLSKAQLHSTTNEVDFFSKARQSGLDIRYTTISDGYPLSFDREVHYLQHWESLVYDFPALVDEFVGKMFQADPFLAPNLLVTDTICAWTAAVADKYNLVNVSFWTQSGLAFSLLYHLDLLKENNHFPCKDNIDEKIDYIPGVESINTRDFMPFLKQSESGGLVIRALLMAFEEVKRADFILHNTVHQVESQTLSALDKYQKIYAIGPLNFSHNLVTKTVNMSLWMETDCTPWLESKPPSSVLYVSFGSFVHINKQIIEEIAYGLLLSEVNFIWVIRDGILGTIDANVLPDGFEEEVKDRGLVVGWCDQIRVLLDPAVGGFLSHCGWNSTLESMWCGVPMLCYPIAHDQPTNRKIVIDDWNIGINLCDGKPVQRKEVAAKIKNFMSGDVREGMKQRADEVKVKLHNAMGGDDGSSERNFENFVNDLKNKIHKLK